MKNKLEKILLSKAFNNVLITLFICCVVSFLTMMLILVTIVLNIK